MTIPSKVRQRPGFDVRSSRHSEDLGRPAHSELAAAGVVVGAVRARSRWRAVPYGLADGLTLADGNLEGANMLALQTRQQLSITALSLASQANQAVLRLFG